MAAPPKPWEMAEPSQRIALESSLSSSNFVPFGDSKAMTSGGSAAPAIPPALPPRPYTAQTNSFSPFGAYGTGFNSYGYNGLCGNSYSGYGNSYNGYSNSYNGYGSAYGGFGNQGFGGFCGGFPRFNGNMYNDVESRFIQLAEQSTRPAFQSIESIVGAVGSIAMMLENTFFAMTSSFRAILGVAENFGRLRSLFAQFWSAFAVFRALNWLLRKILVFLGIRTQDEFHAWAEATMHPNESNTDERPRTSSWPALLFLAVIGAVPYIIVKMLGTINATIQGNVSDPTTWKNSMQALAQYDFQASSPREISFRTHQVITLAPQNLQGDLWNSGWLLGTVDQKTIGLVPVNYFKVIRNPNSITAGNMPTLPPHNIDMNNCSQNPTADILNSVNNRSFIYPNSSNLETVVNNSEATVDKECDGKLTISEL